MLKELMSRVQYNDDCDEWDVVKWGGRVKSALQGKPGKAFLKELESALLAMPTKELIKDNWLVGGQVCSLGAVEVYRTM